MRIGYFTTWFPYAESFQDPALFNEYPVGGSQLAAYKLALNMAKLGHKVTVFTTSIDSKGHVEEFEGIKVNRYATIFKFMKAYFSFLLLYEPMKQDVDIVHAHHYAPPGDLAAFIYAKLKKKPLIIHYHTDLETNYGKLIRKIVFGFYNRFILNMILSTAKVIICASDYFINESHFLPNYREKIVTIPYGINPEEIEVPYSKDECRRKLSLPMDDKIILYVGALVPYKSPNVLIESLPLIIKKIPDAKLIIVGAGPLLNDLKALAEKLSISDKVNLTGMVSDDLKALYYNAADVFVLPSTTRGESFGIVVLEAAAAGLPIVVSSLNAFRCIITDGYNGLVSAIGDTKSLAENIIRILSDPALATMLGGNAKNRVKDFSWEAIARKTEKVYDTVLKNM